MGFFIRILEAVPNSIRFVYKMFKHNQRKTWEIAESEYDATNGILDEQVQQVYDINIT